MEDRLKKIKFFLREGFLRLNLVLIILVIKNKKISL